MEKVKKKKSYPDDIKEINKAIKQADEPVFNLFICSYKNDCCLPRRTKVLFFSG